MPIVDSKKTATIANLLHQRVVEPILQARDAAAALRQAITDGGLAARFTPAELTGMDQFASDLAALAASPLVAAIQNRYVPTHRSKALIIKGVNDG